MDFMKKITEISKKVGDVATDTYNTVADKSGKLFDVAKMKITVSDKQIEIDEIYQNVGKTVYDMYKTGEDVGKVFTKEAKKIDKLNDEIADLEKKILYNKGLRVCGNCGDTIEVDSTFCSNCGQKQKVVKIKEEKKDEKKEVKEEKKDVVCPQCGLVLESNVKFCSKCGYSIEKQ